MKNNEIRVSIICNAYNQEKYIARALEGFVTQKTDFAFEVLVHDDASTDATPQIIKAYAEKYPDVIKPIIQTENQYSKKVSITTQIQMPRAKGDYIAFCEGDDYWIDSQKLQKQFEALERHPEINMCANAAYHESEGKIIEKAFPDTKNRIFSVEEVIVNDGDFVATASLFFRKKMFENEQYSFCRKFPYDYAWQILGSLNRGILFLGDVMTVYRINAAGSWTERTVRNPQKTAETMDRIIGLLDLAKEEIDQSYHDVIEFQKNVYCFKKACVLDDEEKVKEARKNLCTVKALSFYKYYMPRLRSRKWVKYHFPVLRKIF